MFLKISLFLMETLVEAGGFFFSTLHLVFDSCLWTSYSVYKDKISFIFLPYEQALSHGCGYIDWTLIVHVLNVYFNLHFTLIC